MRPSEPSVTAALDAAESLIRATAATAVVQASESLLLNLRSAGPSRQRGQLAFAQLQILQSQKQFLASFGTALRDAVQAARPADAGARRGPDRPPPDAAFARMGQLIASNCATELRELAGYTSALLGHAAIEPERNPVRGQNLGTALHAAITQAFHEPETQVIFAREIGRSMALAMPGCYRKITAELHRRGVRPLAPPAGARPVPQTPVDLLDSLMRGGALEPGASAPAPTEAERRADAAMLDLMQRLSQSATDELAADGADAPDGLDAPPAAAPGIPAAAPSRAASTPASSGEPAPRQPSASQRANAPTLRNYDAQPPAAADAELKAPNLIRAHRDALMQASSGTLDHLVIEVVSSLFDQVLSDERIPPQLARQIARLQLPVLRVALKDPTFFSSSTHPVRGFINRVASLACAFDDFGTGPSRELMARIGTLVRGIAEGDFDQLALYQAKLLELEQFSAEQNEAALRESAAATVLRAKEREWRLQQQFGRALDAELAPLALPDFIRTFLAGPWARAVVTATVQDGAEAVRPRQLRATGVALAKSLRPKRTAADRSRFIAELPPLMRALGAGMDLGGWPQPARQQFLDQLMAVHAGSLKPEAPELAVAPGLDAALALPLPDPEAPGADLPATAESGAGIEAQYSEDEGRVLGLLSDKAVDWSQPLESRPRPQALVPSASETNAPAAATADGGTGAGASATTAPPADVRDGLQIGMAYQFNLKDQWEKVRLTYMSPSRNLFLFTHGANDRETISMTTRMLTRLCETGRMRAYENAYLMDRATQRARQQLATRSPAGAAATVAAAAVA